MTGLLTAPAEPPADRPETRRARRRSNPRQRPKRASVGRSEAPYDVQPLVSGIEVVRLRLVVMMIWYRPNKAKKHVDRRV